MNLRHLLLLNSALAFLSPLHAAPPDKLELKNGEHVALVGNALADRMQHTGWLETLIAKRFAKEQIAFRNLAAAADEVSTWHRSEQFGSRNEWLTWTQADVIFAFYGFNESFKGAEGLEKFKGDLDKFLKEMAKQNFGGHGAPRVVLFSPIANEKHQDSSFADPTPINANLKLYTAAMAGVAKANDVQFIDLFTPSLDVFKDAAARGQSLTMNGMHLSEAGEKALAPLIFRALFGESAPAGDLEKLRAAVLDKSWQWHQRYRTIDGYNVYGGRSREKYAPKDKDGKTGEPIFNNVVMQREMQQRDVMTANRDQRVWAVANGGDLVVKDDNLPAPVPVGTNKPGDKPDLSHTYLDGAEALAKIKVNANCTVNLFADEKQFPELANPVQMAWDTKGRLWVAAWKNYPEREPTSKDGDKLLIFEDTNGDGKADKCTTFMDDLNAPTGFSFYKEGVLVMQAPDLWYVPIDKATGKAGTKERVLMGLDSADSHHTTNALNPDPAGAIYPSDGVFHRTQIETAIGPVRHSDAIAWRFEPRTGKMEKYAPYGLVNPHGKVWDAWGDDILTNATSNGNYFGPAISGHLDNGDHPGIKDFWNRPSRPCPGTWMISSRHFPEDWQGNFLNCNVIGDQCIYRVKVTQDGSGLKGETIEKLVSANPAEHPTFRPICVDIGPDGALYFCDWSQTIIGHLQHHLRDPNRDHRHGRIYRVTYNGRPLLTPPKIDGQPIAALLELLKLPEDDTRTLAKIELGKHDSAEVAAAAKQWAASLDKTDKNYEHHRLEALWVCQWHNVVDADLLKQVLASPEPRARAAATKVLCYQRDRVPDALALLQKAAGDADPRVRLHAVRAASFFNGKDVPAAFDVAYASLKHESDYYLDYVYKETLRQLRTLTKETPLPGDSQVLSKVIEKMSDGDLGKAPATEPVLFARLERKSTDFGGRDQIINDLAKLHGTDRVSELVTGLQRLDAKGAGAAADDLGKMLGATPAADLGKSRAALASLTDAAKQAGVRRAAWAALIIADASPQTTWSGTKTDGARENLIDAIAFLPDPTLRAKFQPLLNTALSDAKTSAAARAAALHALPLMGVENAKANFVSLAAHLQRGLERTAAARAIVQLPRDSWTAAGAAPAAASILAWAKTVPAGDRTKQDFIEITQAGMELAGLLPPADATLLRKELRGLGVSVFVIKTVREQMRYDTTRLVVEAGKPFEIIIENTDAMPHNIVFVEPGTRQSVAESVQTQPPDKLDKEGRAYVPSKDKRVWGASKLVEPGQKETLKLTAPATEGDYEYVCTFPGHWMIMWGKIIVTKDVDAYLQAHPVADAVPAGAVDHSAHQHAAR